MKCIFPFYIGEKRDELKTPKSLSAPVSTSSLTDDEVRRFGSEFNSRAVSDTSAEFKGGRSPFPSLSQSVNNLRVFMLSELKTATKNFNRTTKVGEGGFGCVYKCAIKSHEDSPENVDVAVKQLGKRGFQARFLMHLFR